MHTDILTSIKLKKDSTNTTVIKSLQRHRNQRNTDKCKIEDMYVTPVIQLVFLM
jgi:hypothetical protein